MKFLHIKNIEKYHPNYKDRQLIWCKAYFSMVNSDPDFMLLDEVDKWRFIAFVMIELQLQKPIPLDERYLSMRGFDFKRRNISLTLNMLHNFVDVCYGDVENPSPREEKSREEKNIISHIHTYDFNDIWIRYPRRVGKKDAERHFKASVKTSNDWKDINVALQNYLMTDTVRNGFIKNGSAWFNIWQDYVDVNAVTGKSKELLELEGMMSDR